MGPPLPDSIPEQVGDKRRGQVWALGLVVQQGLSRRWVAKAMGVQHGMIGPHPVCLWPVTGSPVIKL